MENQQLIELTADIVAAHVSNNSVAVGDVSQLVERVHGALAELAHRDEKEPETREPVVSARASIKPDYLVCLVCGAKQKTLKRHLQSAHDMSPNDYRDAFELWLDYPMVSANYSATRSAMAKKIGLGRKPKASAAKTGSKSQTSSSRSTKNTDPSK